MSRKVRRGAVLYLALEDDYPRLQERLYRMFGVDSAGGLFLSISAHTLGDGLEKQLEGFVQEHPDTRLIIIDTLQKIREAGGDKYSYGNDYEIIGKLKQFEMCIRDRLYIQCGIYPFCPGDRRQAGN